MSKFYNIDISTDLGGVNASDIKISSQKAIKTYIDGSLQSVQQVYKGSSTPQDPNILIWIDTNNVSEYESFITSDQQPLVTSDNLMFLVTQ